MKDHWFRFIFRSLLLLVLLVLPFSVVTKPVEINNGGQTIQLRPPSFVTEARADSSVIGNILDTEAGISAYGQFPSGVVLSQIKGLFRTIELETSSYIIGSIGVPNYSEHYDVHVYVNQNGWILAYYPKGEPVSIIVDIRQTDLNSNKLKTVIALVAATVGAPVPTLTYYHFAYPNATNILMVAEDSAGGNTFTIKLPSTYGYSEFSWALHNGYPYDFSVDGTNNPHIVWDENYYVLGFIYTSELLPDVEHTITADIYGVLVILYRVP